MEAMACACPPLVSSIPANLEWVVDGEQGWVFRDGYAGDLAQKIIHIARHRREAMEKGRLARKTAESRADWKKNTMVLMQTYQDVWRYHIEQRK
jgi:glycosyltransferase involved in cell wall biosynthesis